MTHIPGMTLEGEPQHVQMGTHVMLNAMVYSAVVVVQMMETAQNAIETIYQRQVKPDNGLKYFILRCMNMLLLYTIIVIYKSV